MCNKRLEFYYMPIDCMLVPEDLRCAVIGWFQQLVVSDMEQVDQCD
jgi:hypothetical protein